MLKRRVLISVLIAPSLLICSSSWAAPVKVCDLVTAAQATELMGGQVSRTMPIGGALVTAVGLRGCYYFGPSAHTIGMQIMSAAGFGTADILKLNFSHTSKFPVDVGSAARFGEGNTPGTLELQVLLPGDKEVLIVDVSPITQESDSARVRAVMVDIAKTVISDLPVVAPSQPAAASVPQGPTPRPASHSYNPGDMPSKVFRGRLIGGPYPQRIEFVDDATNTRWPLDDPEFTIRNPYFGHVVVKGYVYTDGSRFHFTEFVSVITP